MRYVFGRHWSKIQLKPWRWKFPWKKFIFWVLLTKSISLLRIAWPITMFFLILLHKMINLEPFPQNCFFSKFYKVVMGHAIFTKLIGLVDKTINIMFFQRLSCLLYCVGLLISIFNFSIQKLGYTAKSLGQVVGGCGRALGWLKLWVSIFLLIKCFP